MFTNYFHRGTDNVGDVLCVFAGRPGSLHEELDGAYSCARIITRFVCFESILVSNTPLCDLQFTQWGATLIPLWILEVSLGIGAIVMSLRTNPCLVGVPSHTQHLLSHNGSEHISMHSFSPPATARPRAQVRVRGSGYNVKTCNTGSFGKL